MNFPHLKDTSFPDLQTADVYQFRNTFDYTRWNEDTKIKLVNVIWNSDYSDVVKFETNEARDNYFNNIEDFYAIELMQAARIVPQNFVKLPIPYDVMARYNYLFIDMPIAANSDSPIDYETGYGIKRWYFFVDDIVYQAPNTTQVFLSLDVWTNFQNEIEINYMMLERGHAPVSASDTEEYLENPIENNRYLLAPDVNYDNANISRSNVYVPFGNGKKYVCMASTCAPEQVTSLGLVTPDANYNPFVNLTYSDVDARYGQQLQVNGLTVGNGRNYGAARTLAKPAASSENFIPNNLTVYAVEASECYGSGTFFSDTMRDCPQFLNTIQACFVVDEHCIILGDGFSVGQHLIFQCVGDTRTMLVKNLQKSDFNFPQELERFAKLYTSPYSAIEVTDNDGSTFTVNIEETTTLQLKSVVSVAFPYLNYRVFLDGVGGMGNSSYTWMDLRDSRYLMDISNSDWFKYCFDWDIPTFALFMDGETAFQLANFNRAIDMGIRNALAGYHNAMRSANTANANAVDAANTALANVNNSTETARTNAYNSADTGKTNADNTANTGKTNADASADTTYANVDATCNTNSDNLEIKIAKDFESAVEGFLLSEFLTNLSNNVNQANWWSDLEIAARALGVEAEAMTTLMGNSFINNVGNGLVQGAVSGAQMGGAMGAGIGALTGEVMGGFNAYMNAQQQSVAISSKGEIWDAQADIGQEKWARNVDLTTKTTVNGNDTSERQIEIQSEAAREQLANTNALDRANAGRNRDTQKANATRSSNTAKTNATNTQSTSKTNANNNYNTDRTNASNTRNTTVANSGYTRQVAELNAKEILENAATSAMAAVKDARNAKPVPIGKTGGNAGPDYMRNRGIQLKVKTQSDSAIRQTGDTFARYGYMLNQIWNVRESGLTLMQHFTYWKASDIWVDDRQSSNNTVQNFITRIFLNGVTVWSNPNEIGRVNIYDN